jgi:competence protein ComFC
MDILDFVFPKKCVNCKKLGEYLCSDCFSLLSFDVKQYCLVCKKPTLNGLTHPSCLGKYTIDGYFSALASNRTSKKLINSFGNKPYLKDLKTVLSDLFYESLIQNEQFQKELKRKWVLVPLPLSKAEQRKMGYSQAEILAVELGKRLGIEIKKDFSKLENKNAFLVADTILRLKEVASILKKIGCKKVIGLTLVDSQ